MIRLINSEFKKIFSKKAIYVLLIIGVAFSILTNVLYKFISTVNMNVYKETDVRDVYTDELKNLDPNKADDLVLYIDDSTEIYIYDYCEKSEEWRCDYLAENYHDDIHNYFESKYDKKSGHIESEIKAKLDNEIALLESVTWEEMMNNKITSTKELIASLENSTITERVEKNNINMSLVDAKLDLLKYELLLENKAMDSNDYLNIAINDYVSSKRTIDELSLKDELDEDEEDSLKQAKATHASSKYAIDNHYEASSKINLLALLKNFNSDYLFFVIISLIVIASSIMANEYHKGTIKQLLIKPYTRTQIYLSKFFTVLLFIPIFILFLFMLDFIIGGLFFGFDSIKEPIVIYNFAKESIVEYNLISYTLLSLLSKLPMLILVTTLAYVLSVIVGSTAVATMIPLFIYYLGSLFNLLINTYNIWWLKWFITNIWDFNTYLFSEELTETICSLPFCIVSSIIYFIVMFTTGLFIFKKKDIKNV